MNQWNHNINSVPFCPLKYHRDVALVVHALAVIMPDLPHEIGLCVLLLTHIFMVEVDNISRPLV